MNYTENEIIKLIDDGKIVKLIKFKKVQKRIKEICEQNKIDIIDVLILISEILTELNQRADIYSGSLLEKTSRLWEYINILEIKKERKT